MAYHFDKMHQCERYDIGIDSAAQYGYFQNNQTGTEGGLRFEKIDGKLSLCDYDGVYQLSDYVIKTCEQLGVNMDYAKDD